MRRYRVEPGARYAIGFSITFALIAFLSLSHAGTLEGDNLRSIPNDELPLKVALVINIVDLTDVNEREETIEFDGSVVIYWDDPRQAYDSTELGFSADEFPPGVYTRPPPRIYQGDFAVKEIFQGWRPHIKLANGVGDREKNYMAIGVWPDGRMVYTDSFHATIETPMDLRLFPFDRQSLKIFLAPQVYKNDELILLPSAEVAGTWKKDRGIIDWIKLDSAVKGGVTEWATPDGMIQSYSTVTVTLNLVRRPGHILLSIFLPLVVLVALSWCVFWMDDESISNRVNISFIGILSVVAFYFVVLDSVPEIPYVTLMDAFIISTFLVLAASLVINFVVDELNATDRKLFGDKVDIVCRWLFPIGYASITALLGLIFFSLY